MNRPTFGENPIQTILIVIVLFVLALSIYSCTTNSDRKDITAWMQSNGETVTSVEPKTWNIGPYFHMKSARYYRVQTDKNVYWFKYLWGRTVEKEVGTGYQEFE